MKVSELVGAKLDYWTAKAEGRDVNGWGMVPIDAWYSSRWEVGGPIIERERIAIVPWKTADGGVVWTAYGSRSGADLEMLRGYFEVNAGVGDASPTPLIAAMRAFVASNFGDNVPDAA
jgi:hypothetical protein